MRRDHRALRDKGKEDLIKNTLKTVAKKAVAEAKEIDNQPREFIEGCEKNVQHFDAMHPFIAEYENMSIFRRPTDLKFRALNRATKRWELVKNFNSLPMKEKDQIAEAYISYLQQQYHKSTRPFFFNLHVHGGSERIVYPNRQMMRTLGTKRLKNKQFPYKSIKTDEENRIKEFPRCMPSVNMKDSKKRETIVTGNKRQTPL